ncbi:MarR family winged helix-turn-helix transcriptional regulator [Microbispora sp. H10670]|uniref:MarR family winged helix-turn-helix transcriptional regulator n=1 Tax=Microbispora sp. H10670 TaxID=2729108 RepID=UPI001601BA06|nr:MarR family transcriptional regulator [Microbispora sp. H10670]
MTAKDLRISVGLLARRIRQLYTIASDDDLTFTELGVLARLEREGPQSSVQLAALERISAQAVGTSLSELHRRGLVIREADPDDGRRVITSLSDAGRIALSNREEVITERLAVVVNNLSAEERDRLAAALPVLRLIAERL